MAPVLFKTNYFLVCMQPLLLNAIPNYIITALCRSNSDDKLLYKHDSANLNTHKMKVLEMKEYTNVKFFQLFPK